MTPTTAPLRRASLFCPLWRALKWVHDAPARFGSSLANLCFSAFLLFCWIMCAYAAHFSTDAVPWWQAILILPVALIAIVIIGSAVMSLCYCIHGLWKRFGVLVSKKVDQCEDASAPKYQMQRIESESPPTSAKS